MKTWVLQRNSPTRGTGRYTYWQLRSNRINIVFSEVRASELKKAGHFIY